MEKVAIKKLDQKRFEALAGYSRSPAAAYFSKELAWYSNNNETVLGVLLLDNVDSDFAAVILGRDEGDRFRTIDVGSSFPNEDHALKWLDTVMRWHSDKDQKVFPQGDTRQGLNLFTPIVPKEKMHVYFSRLISDNAFTPAREIINNMMPHFTDVDGNFAEQFQSSGFDARIWELCLYAYLTEEQLFMDCNYNAPDFVVKKYGKTVAIEAVTVNRKNDNPPKYFKEFPIQKTPSEILEENENAMPIRFGSPLYSKLQKKYWELAHVSGNPLVFAIADFHDDQSMLWSSTALINYLYGVRHDFHYDGDNKLVITPHTIKTHRVGEKEIPSGYFFQPDAEQVSAVLFSASGTISKFNRMGRQAGFKDPTVVMIRVGTYHDHDPNAAVPKMFRYMVDETSNETWGEGFSMFHNPNAIHPVPEELFPSIGHHHFQNGQIVSRLPDFYLYASVTYNLRIKK